MATYIYHITRLDNLPSIVASGGLASLSRLRLNGLTHHSIAYETVQDQRAIKLVECGPGGCLHDYVPFYFAPRSPMLYAISRGAVPSCPEGQRDIVYLVASAEAVAGSGLPFVFSDGHGIMAWTRFFSDLANLGQIDWNLMRSRYWRDTDQDGDRSRRRQAEFLVYEFFPWRMVKGIAVRHANQIDEVRQQLGDCGPRTTIRARPNWYY